MNIPCILTEQAEEGNLKDEVNVKDPSIFLLPCSLFSVLFTGARVSVRTSLGTRLWARVS